ncbi:MAG: AMP-binding protein [Chloroflexota bacterium]
MAKGRKYWDEAVETLPPKKLRRLQGERLQQLVQHAYEKTALYRRKLDEAGVKPGDIKGLDDLQKLPVTDDVKDIRGRPFAEKLAIPLNRVKMFHSTSGTTTGIPEAVPFSARDVKVFFYGEARGRWTLGARPWDVVQVLTRFDCCHWGYKTMGATMVMLSAGRYNTDQQIHLTRAAEVTVIEHMPSLVVKYFERAKELGIDIRDTKLRMVSGVGEALAETSKRKVEERYGIPFMTLWGSVELGVAAVECEVRNGMHIFADLTLIEVVDPETLKPLPPGEDGELIVTPLWGDAMPLIRYRLGDVAHILPYQPCPCGRTLPRMSYVKGRASQIVNVNGRKILPLDLEEALARTEGLAPDYQIVVDKPGVLPRLKVKAEYLPASKDLARLKARTEDNIGEVLGVKSEVELVPQGYISAATTTFKAQRVVKTYK